MDNFPAYVALFFSGATLVILVGEKLFGGGNALAAKFHQTELKLNAFELKNIATHTALRTELMARIDQYEDNAVLSVEAIKANIHALQLGLLEFRAKMAEDYVRTGGLDRIENDMRNGFEKVERRMSELQDLIVWASPQPANPNTHRNGDKART